MTETLEESDPIVGIEAVTETKNRDPLSHDPSGDCVGIFRDIQNRHGTACPVVSQYARVATFTQQLNKRCHPKRVGIQRWPDQSYAVISVYIERLHDYSSFEWPIIHPSMSDFEMSL
jgi:hypothetical protein